MNYHEREFFSRREVLQIAAETYVTRLLQPTPESTPTSPLIYFPETGHHLEGEFLAFFRRHSRLSGRPITEPILDREGRKIQYFEYTRLEHHPEYMGTPYEIQLGLLGEETIPDAARQSGSLSLNTEFFKKNGGNDFFGIPISEVHREADKRYQYAQRFLLVEYDQVEPERNLLPSYRLYRQNKSRYPRLLWPGEITLFPLGKMVAEKYGIDTRPVEKDPQAIVYSPSLGNQPKRIEVSIVNQTLMAFEDDLPVLHTSVSTGAYDFDTPRGHFSVLAKIDVMDYRSPFPERRNYYLPSVPFNLRVVGAVLIHGTYWHSNFGTRMSAGCVNLNLDDAWWIYNWARVGTPVMIR